MHVERDLTVTSLLGTVLIRRHLGGQVLAQTYLAHTCYLTTHDATPDGSISHPHFRFKSISTIQTASQHTWAEDGYLNRPHPLNIGGDFWLDRWLVCGWTWGWAYL
jgi:hypothetical protein